MRSRDNIKEFGILDGGHTYTAIIENREELNDDIDKYVKLEIIVGENLTTSRIADARNTSNEVSDIALYELDDKFDFIKKAIENEPFATEIAYKDNDDKRLPVIEFLKLLFAYNTFKYPDGNNVPIQAYSGKAAVFKDVKKDLDSKTVQYTKLSKLLPMLVKLYDEIELTFESKYKLYSPNGRIRRLRGVERGENGKKFKTTFLQNETDIKIANGFILPIFGAFRALIDIETLEFKTNPIDLWNKMGQELIKNTLETTRNPQDAGKSAVLWSGNYRIILVELLSNL
ncbi:AIPR family protein [Pseudolactococcus yaeyamensis]